MPRKCSAGNCSGNYDSQKDRVKVYEFPRNKELCEKWLAALPNIIKSPTDNMGICEKHWPIGCKMYYPPRSKYQVSTLLFFYNAEYKVKYNSSCYFRLHQMQPTVC